MFGKYHKSPAARVLHHRAPKVAKGFGGGEQRGDQYLAPHSSRLLLQTSFPFFTTTAIRCLLQGILELRLPAPLILCFYKFHMLLPFSSSLTLIVWPLQNEAYSLNTWRKNSCLGGGGYGQMLKAMEHLCQKNLSCFLTSLGKVLLLYQAKELLSLPVYSLIFPRQNQDRHRPFS